MADSTPTQADLDENVRAFISIATGLDVDKNVIPGNDSHAAPVSTYATVLEIAKRGLGIDQEIARNHLTNPLLKTMYRKGRREIVYSIQIYGDDAPDKIEKLLSFPSTATGILWLEDNGLFCWGMAGEVRNLDNVEGTKYEKRRSVDITLKYKSTYTENINIIDKVDIEIDMSAETDIMQ